MKVFEILGSPVQRWAKRRAHSFLKTLQLVSWRILYQISGFIKRRTSSLLSRYIGVKGPFEVLGIAPGLFLKSEISLSFNIMDLKSWEIILKMYKYGLESLLFVRRMTSFSSLVGWSFLKSFSFPRIKSF